jgi:peptidoglycan/LPS O-acetylase OafA/YrhL
MSFFLVHGWGFTLVDNWPWNAPSWSISTEIFCYLLFPLFLYLAKKYTPILLVMVLISGFTFMWQYEVIENTYNTPYKFMLIRTVPAFILGVLIYDFHGLFRRLSSSILFVIQSLCLILIFTILITGGSKLWLMPFFAILILSLFHDRGGIASVLSSRPLHGLGVISYAVYMIHYPLLDFWMRFTDFGEDHGGVLAVIGMLSITIILSMLAYRFIENPARKKIRQIGRRLY